MAIAEAEASFRNGDIDGAMRALQQVVRSEPDKVQPRIFLAQLMMVIGDWDRALTQLDLIAELSVEAIPMRHTYATAIQCERLRESVFRGERSPLVLGDPEPWLALLVQSLSVLSQGRVQEAAGLRAQAFEQAESTAGTINGMPFEWVADADCRLGPVLEVLLNGAYYWVPFSRLRKVAVEPPTDVRDLVWLPAQFVWTNGGEAFGLIPSRYPSSERAADPAIRLARRTEWRDLGHETFVGLGQRLLATDAAEVGLLELRELDLSVQR